MGVGDAEGGELAGTGLDPEAALEWAAGWCRDCPLRARCPQEACRVWRIEGEAVAALRKLREDVAATPLVAGVPLRVLS